MSDYKEYPSLPVEDYNAIKAVRNSRMKDFVRSPRHYQYFSRSESPRTAAMDFGVMFHVFIFEGAEEFNKRYFFIDEEKRPDKKHGMSAARNVQWLALEMEKMPVGAQSYDNGQLLQMERMKASILENPIAAQMLAEEGLTEYSVVKDYMTSYRHWEKRYPVMTTVQVKIRMDKYIHHNVFGRKVIIDLKTAEDGDPDVYDRKAWELGYHRAAALYSDTIGADDFYLIVVEKAAPFVCCVYGVHDSLIEKGRLDDKTGYEKILAGIAECRDRFGSEFSAESKPWPGYEWKADEQGDLWLKAPFYK